jgi:hypothetical protein
MFKFFSYGFLSFSSLGCNYNPQYPVALIKVWDEGCVGIQPGLTYTMARVESLRLCVVLSNAWNEARINNQNYDYGICHLNYHFQCLDDNHK